MLFTITVTPVIKDANIEMPRQYNNALEEKERDNLFVSHGDGKGTVEEQFVIFLYKCPTITKSYIFTLSETVVVVNL